MADEGKSRDQPTFCVEINPAMLYKGFRFALAHVGINVSGKLHSTISRSALISLILRRVQAVHDMSTHSAFRLSLNALSPS
jgi:hypothetical protein